MMIVNLKGPIVIDRYGKTYRRTSLNDIHKSLISTM